MGQSRAGEEAVPAGRLDGLLRPEVVAAFDRSFFEREGYWVWEGVLTEAGRRRWTASLQRLQQMNDGAVVETDWGSIDFAGRGLLSPDPVKITPAALRGYCGGSEQMKFLPPDLRTYMYQRGLLGPAPSLVVPGAQAEGIFPEYFPGAYDNFILDATTAHPQMMELLGKVLGPRFIIDHVLMLNRAPGTGGRRWHGHPYLDGQYEVEDPIGTGHALSKDFLPQQCVRTLCYPEGASCEEGGEFAVIPGAHLYRIPYKWSTARPDGDEAMEAGWMQGKIHAFTGAPLQIRRFDVPPGSMVSFVHHMPHHVGYRQADAPTRWGLLMAYRTPDSRARPSTWSSGGPQHWLERMEKADKISDAARRVLQGDVPLGAV
ncbi:MAG: hypothetical protein GKR89_22010 [Candidatus Latescibacteria bacterium]|nr:hypothetical protein [Candidatus Latescibacterota bacterium]